MMRMTMLKLKLYSIYDAWNRNITDTVLET